MIVYYQTYRRGQEGKEPSGIFIGATGNHAMFWDHDQQAWIYDPERIARFTDKPENIDRFDPISREQAEEVMKKVSKAGEPLPDEDTILWIFQWKGAPPQTDD